jgi:hypothetical protein
MSVRAIIQAVKTKWLSNSVLNTIPIRNTRIQTGELTPYALVKVKDAGQKLDSGWSYVKKYKVIIEVWGSIPLSQITLISDAMVNEFDFIYDIAFVNADLLLWRPESDENDLDEKDYYGDDVRTLRQIWYVTLNEYKIR